MAPIRKDSETYLLLLFGGILVALPFIILGMILNNWFWYLALLSACAPAAYLCIRVASMLIRGLRR